MSMEERFENNCGLLISAGFVRELDPLDNGLFIHPTEKRAVAPSALHSASREDIEEFIRGREILWGVEPSVQRSVLRRLGYPSAT